LLFDLVGVGFDGWALFWGAAWTLLDGSGRGAALRFSGAGALEGRLGCSLGALRGWIFGEGRSLEGEAGLGRFSDDEGR
jgi:hypothetical protein